MPLTNTYFSKHIIIFLYLYTRSISFYYSSPYGRGKIKEFTILIRRKISNAIQRRDITKRREVFFSFFEDFVSRRRKFSPEFIAKPRFPKFPSRVGASFNRCSASRRRSQNQFAKNIWKGHDFSFFLSFFLPFPFDFVSRRHIHSDGRRKFSPDGWNKGCLSTRHRCSASRRVETATTIAKSICIIRLKVCWSVTSGESEAGRGGRRVRGCRTEASGPVWSSMLSNNPFSSTSTT